MITVKQLIEYLQDGFNGDEPIQAQNLKGYPIQADLQIIHHDGCITTIAIE